MRKYGSAEVRKCRSTEVRKYRSTEVRKYISAEVRKYVSTEAQMEREHGRAGSMAFLYDIITYRGEQAAEITGFEGARAVLAVPEEIGGFAVRSIGRGAFRGMGSLEDVRLPDSLRRIMDFAFYDCAGLKRLSMPDRVADVSGGALRGCGALSEVEVRVRCGNFSCVRDILQDTDRAMSIRLVFEAPAENAGGAGFEEALLYFPSYVNDFDEDTMARAIHPRIEGCGYAYREIVTRAAVDFRGYDRLLPRAAADGPILAAETAFARLMFPYSLSAEARAAYEEHLLKTMETVLPHLAETGSTERVAFLAARGLLKEPGISAALETASAKGETEIVGLLMDAEAGTRRPVFSLDDL